MVSLGNEVVLGLLGKGALRLGEREVMWRRLKDVFGAAAGI